MALSPMYAAILQDLNKAVAQNQPEDVLQFCANWVSRGLPPVCCARVPPGGQDDAGPWQPAMGGDGCPSDKTGAGGASAG